MLLTDIAELVYLVFANGLNFNIWGQYKAGATDNELLLKAEENAADVINAHLYDVNGIVDKIDDTITISTTVELHKKTYPVRTSVISWSGKDVVGISKIIRTHIEAAMMVINKSYNEFLQEKLKFSSILKSIGFEPQLVDVSEMTVIYCQIFENEIPYVAKTSQGQYKDFTLSNANPDDKITNRSIMSLVEETGSVICSYFDSKYATHTTIRYQSKDSLGNDIQIVSEIDCDDKFNGLLFISSISWFKPSPGEERQGIGGATSIHGLDGASDIMQVVQNEIYNALYFIYKITSNQVNITVQIYKKDIQEEIYV